MYAQRRDGKTYRMRVEMVSSPRHHDLFYDLANWPGVSQTTLSMTEWAKEAQMGDPNSVVTFPSDKDENSLVLRRSQIDCILVGPAVPGPHGR